MYCTSSISQAEIFVFVKDGITLMPLANILLFTLLSETGATPSY